MTLGSNPWDSFRETMRESDDVLDAETVTIYNYTGGYDESDGQTDWTRGNGTEIRAIVQIDQPNVISDASGLQSDGGDADMVVRDDAESYWDFMFYSVGTDNVKPTEVEYQGRVFIVGDVIDQKNGLKLIPMVEADR